MAEASSMEGFRFRFRFKFRCRFRFKFRFFQGMSKAFQRCSIQEWLK